MSEWVTGLIAAFHFSWKKQIKKQKRKIKTKTKTIVKNKINISYNFSLYFFLFVVVYESARKENGQISCEM